MMASAITGIESDRYPHPCPLPARGRETLSFSLHDLTHRVCGSLVSSPLAGEGQGGGYLSPTELCREAA